MHYLLNHAFIFFLTIAVALAYDGTAPYGFILAFLLSAVALHLVAAYYATSKYNDLKDRIKKLENKKVDK
nr:MAG TPA: hypothetical protein [Caudoviricetes sp.]